MAEALKLDNQLCFALHAASRAMTAAYQPLLEALEVTYPQYLVLLTLWEEDGARRCRGLASVFISIPRPSRRS